MGENNFRDKKSIVIDEYGVVWIRLGPENIACNECTYGNICTKIPSPQKLELSFNNYCNKISFLASSDVGFTYIPLEIPKDLWESIKINLE